MPPLQYLTPGTAGGIELTSGETTLSYLLPVTDVTPQANKRILVKAAKLTLLPFLDSTKVVFADVATDGAPMPDCGIVLHPAASEATYWSSVDFGSPRTITAVKFTCFEPASATVQIDLGGTFMTIAPDGTLCVPSGEEGTAPQLTLNTGGGALPLLTSSKIKLTAVDPSDHKLTLTDHKLTLTSVSFRPLPTNLSVRLAGQPPFWTHPGPLTAGITTPDFAGLLTQFLAGSQSSSNQDAHSIPITVHSDVIALLSSATLEIDYEIAHSLLPNGVPALKLTYGFYGCAQEQGSAYSLSTTLPANSTPLKARATIRGEFEPSRLVGCEGSPWATPAELPFHSPIVVELLPGQALAQPFCLAQPSPSERPGRVRITAIDLSAASKVLPASILNLALQSDADGRPSGEVLLSTSVTLDPADLLDDIAALMKASAATEPALLPWISVPLPQPFVLEGTQRYWVVLQVQEGEAIWHCRADSSSQEKIRSLHITKDNGFTWRIAKAQQHEALTAAMRLRHCPKTYRVPLYLRIGTGETAQHFSLDQFSPLGKVDFSFDFLGNGTPGLMAYWGAAGGGSARSGPEEIMIPFSFLSEAPGKLTIEELSITYGTLLGDSFSITLNP